MAEIFTEFIEDSDGLRITFICCCGNFMSLYSKLVEILSAAVLLQTTVLVNKISELSGSAVYTTNKTTMVYNTDPDTCTKSHGI